MRRVAVLASIAFGLGTPTNLGINGDNTNFSALGMNVGWPSANRVAVQNESSVAPGGIAGGRPASP